jgi:hypothetical protein
LFVEYGLGQQHYSQDKYDPLPGVEEKIAQAEEPHDQLQNLYQAKPIEQRLHRKSYSAGKNTHERSKPA